MKRTKAKAQDYLPSMLPGSRKEIFFDVLKLHFGKFLLMGLAILILALPLHLTAIAEDLYVSGIYSSLGTATQQQRLGAQYAVVAVRGLRAFCDIILLMLFAFFFSGVLRVVRQYAWMENVFFITDFWKGWKQNWKQTVLLALLSGISFALTKLAYSLSQLATGVTAFLLVIPIGVLYLFFMPIFGYTLVAIPVYSNTFGKNIKAGFYIYLKNPLRAIFAAGCAMLPFLPLLIPHLYAHLAGRLLGSLLTPMILLGWTLYAYGQFDRYINGEQFPQMVGKGLYNEEQ